MRYQQLYAADQFGGMSGVIDSFAYRVDGNVGEAFTSDPISVQVWLGYSTLNPGELTEVFDDNYSFGKTLVLDANITLSSAGTGAFDVIVDIDDIFSYNGTGNLLMEIIITGDAVTTELDSAGLGLGFPGTAWTDRVWAFGADATTGSLAGDDGLVTQFNIIPAPGALALLGIAGLMQSRRRRR